MLDVVKSLDPLTLDEIAKAHFKRADEQFLAFRHLVDRSLISGWWQKHAARHLRDFYNDLVAGKRPKLVMMAPPQHGKAHANHIPVLTSKGWTTHGQLKIGDNVFHPSGRTTQVLSVSAPC